jgi:hypothetical protein
LHLQEAMWGILSSNATEMMLLRAAQAETVRLRPLAIFGDFYPLSPITANDDACAAWQHHCDGQSTCGGYVHGAIHVFRRPTANSETCLAAPFAIESTAMYNVSYFYGYERDHSEVLPGAALADMKVALQINGSVLIEYICSANCNYD